MYPSEQRSSHDLKNEVNDLFANAVHDLPQPTKALILDSKLFTTTKRLRSLHPPPFRIDVPNPFDFSYMENYCQVKKHMQEVYVHDCLFHEFVKNLDPSAKYGGIWLDEQKTLFGNKVAERNGEASPATSIALCFERKLFMDHSILAVTCSSRWPNATFKYQAITELISLVTGLAPEHGYTAHLLTLRWYDRMHFVLFSIKKMASPPSTDQAIRYASYANVALSAFILCIISARWIRS